MKAKKIFKIFKTVKLTAEDKQNIKNNLLAFMAAHPARENQESRQLFHKNKKFPARLSLTPKFILASVIFAVFLAVGGSVSFAASNSLPGHFLYHLKVDVIEEIRGAFSLSDFSKAEWAIERYGNRVSEVMALNNNDAISDEAKEQMEASLIRHKEKIYDSVQKLEAKENFQAASSVGLSWEARLNAYCNVLENWEENEKIAGLDVNVSAENFQQIKKMIINDHLIANKGRINLVVKIASNDELLTPAQTKENLLQVKQNYAQALQELQSSSLTVNSDLYRYLSAQLKAAEALLLSAEAQLDQQFHTEAYLIISKANLLIRETGITLAMPQKVAAKIQYQSGVVGELEEEINITNKDTGQSKQIIIDTQGNVTIKLIDEDPDQENADNSTGSNQEAFNNSGDQSSVSVSNNNNTDDRSNRAIEIQSRGQIQAHIEAEVNGNGQNNQGSRGRGNNSSADTGL